MNLLIKILACLLCFNIVYANNNFAMKLGWEFQEDVIELNIYKNYYKTYIKKECSNKGILCEKRKVKSLKRWQSSKANRIIEKKLNERLKQTSMTQQYLSEVRKKIAEVIIKKSIKNSEYITLIDISRQLFIVMLYEEKNNTISFIGSDLISTGNIEKEKEVKYGQDHYFSTPSGIYENSLGWRSSGKLNADGVTLAYGQQERFVYYYGKYKSERYHTFDAQGNKIYDKAKWKLISGYLNFAMHAYESPQKLGIAKSHGCVRMSNELNLFLDRNRVLHQNRLDTHLLQGKYSKNDFKNKLNKYSGKILVIVDSLI